MRWCRIRLVLLGLLLCVVHVVSGTCGQRFTDPASSAVLADVVIEGKVRKTSEPDSTGLYNISVAVKKNIFKGANMINRGRPVKSKSITLDKFKNGAKDNKNCIASVQKGRTYLFFLRDSADPKGLYFEIMAMPVKKTKKLASVIRNVSCDNCAKAPSIRNLTGPEKEDINKSITISCQGEGNPPPAFSWYKDGVLVSNSRYSVTSHKRESSLVINWSRTTDTGSYECVAVNVLGEVRKNISLEVFTSQQREPCEIQTYCLNGGICMQTPGMPIYFCMCPETWAGRRCQIPDGFSIKNDYERQATLLLERTLVIVGIVIAVLVFIVICIASYILAKKGRKQFEQRRIRREANRAEYNRSDHNRADYNRPENSGADYNRADINRSDYNRSDINKSDYNRADNNRSDYKSDYNTADNNRTDYNSDYKRPDYNKSDNNRSDHDRPGVCIEDKHVPNVTADKRESEIISENTQWNQGMKPQQQILLQDSSTPPVNQPTHGHLTDVSLQLHPSDVKMIPGEQRPEPRGRLAASSVMELPSFAATVNGRKSNRTSVSPVSENIEMRTLSETARDECVGPERLTNDSRLTLFVEQSLVSPLQSPEPPSSLSISPHRNLSGTSPLLLESSTPTSQPSLNSPSQNQPHHFHESNSSLNENAASVQPLLKHQKNNPPMHKSVQSHRLFESKSDKDLARCAPLSSNMQGIYEPSGNKHDIRDTQLLLKKLSKLSHSNTFPKSKENGLSSDALSDSEEEEDALEIPYEKQLDLYISEEELDLSKENLVSSSFSSVNAPSRQASQEDRGFRPVPNSAISRRGIRKHQSEEGSPYKFINRSHAYLQESTRSRSLDNPQVTPQPQPQRLNSTVAGSPDVETYDNMSQKPLQLHNHVYSYDPNDDSSPWEGDLNKPDNHSSATVDERDKLNRLKDVVPDQQAIPI